MKLSFTLTLAASLLSLSFASALPRCGYTVEECECPNGTQFATSTTRTIIGAEAGDVTAITGHCKPSCSSINHLRSQLLSVVNSLRD
jgi:hypothetical protein